MAPRVVIIGAGMAGISAAGHLYRNGITDIVILEAKNRTGGRIQTVEFGEDGNIVELGANWIHGESEENSVFRLAKQLGRLDPYIKEGRYDQPFSESGSCYRSDGRVIPNELTEKVWAMVRHWCENLTVHHRDLSLLEYFHQCFQNNLEKFPASEIEDANCVLNCIARYYEIDTGGFLKESCSYEEEPYVEMDGGNAKLADGFSALIADLEKDLPREMINLNRHVTSICWSDPQVKVICSGGELYVADHVIVTVSLGYLKKWAQELFVPAIPESKLQAISNMGYGKVNKVYLKWDTPFWNQTNGALKLALTPREMSIDPSSTWHLKIFGFEPLPDNPHVLRVWVLGEAAEAVERIDDGDVIKTLLELLRKMLRDQTIPPPSSMLRTRWCSDPHFLGVYSFRHPRTEPRHIKELSTPLPPNSSDSNGIPRVLFAGEATSLTAYSTVHGARDSGIREAQRIINMYN